MAAKVESMFYVRNKPWHGLGTCVQSAPSSRDALVRAEEYMDSLGKEIEMLRHQDPKEAGRGRDQKAPSHI